VSRGPGEPSASPAFPEARGAPWGQPVEHKQCKRPPRRCRDCPGASPRGAGAPCCSPGPRARPYPRAALIPAGAWGAGVRHMVVVGAQVSADHPTLLSAGSSLGAELTRLSVGTVLIACLPACLCNLNFFFLADILERNFERNRHLQREGDPQKHMGAEARVQTLPRRRQERLAKAFTKQERIRVIALSGPWWVYRQD